MIDIRPFAGLAHRDHGWLDTRFHFSFADYHDPERMSWGNIRVWNDDTIAPQSGFPPHHHANMEIVTFVRTGAITHQDSMGNTGRTAAGDVQVMSAGTGVAHAEYNVEDENTTLFQIWIIPDQAGGEPGWGMREFPRGERATHHFQQRFHRKVDVVGLQVHLPLREDFDQFRFRHRDSGGSPRFAATRIDRAAAGAK